MKNIRYTLLFLFFIPLFSFSQIQYFKLPPHVADSDYMAKTIIVDVKEEYRGQCGEKGLQIEKLSKVFAKIGASDVKKKFPGKIPPAAKLNKYGEKMEDLSLIYEIKYSSDMSVEKAINALLASGIFEYAEPHYIPHLFFVPPYTCVDSIPNDPCAEVDSASFTQYYLVNIKAYKAWCSQQSDTNIVIGITDTGTDIFHPDLYDNIKKNYLDPINGIDDDGDCFSDNFYGWDLAEDDSCPQWETLGHGVFVSGISSAIVNNSEGIAGVGFKAKYLPVKISDAQGALTMAYESIVYAADHGCSVINCSWGGLGGAGEYGQMVINYATNNCDALVVAACGNSGNTYSFYPASYDNVISVAATNVYDCKMGDTINVGSSYGLKVDLCAPGEGIYSTWINGGYIGYSSGTSFSAPAVCGGAALVKNHYPLYSAIQIGEQLKLTTDNIDTLGCNENQPWTGLMGTGRLNLYKALTTDYIPSIVMISKTVTDNNDEAWVENDTLSIVGTFKNYLGESSSGLKVTISTGSPYVTVLDSSTLLGIMNTFQIKDNAADPFLVKILPGVPASTQVDFKLTFEDGTAYKSYQYFSVIINVDYMDIDTNRLAVTVTSKGRIGYNLPGDYSQGIGFTYDNSASYMTTGGFMVGVSTSRVSDNTYGDISGNYDNDFLSTQVVHRVIPEIIADFETECKFNDNLAPSSTRLNVTVTHKSFAWAAVPDDKFIIMEFTVKNHGTQTLNTLYAGLFMDWDMSDGLWKDKVDYDAANKMGYTYSLLGSPYAAIQLLSSGPVHHYAFDKDGTSNGTSTSINISDGFISYEKYNALKTNQPRNTTYPLGNDVADLISSGPFVLAPNDSVVVAFALIAGDHLADIQNSAEEAYEFYNHYGITEFQSGNPLLSVLAFPNPAGDNLSVTFDLSISSDAEISIIDINGKEVMSKKLGKLAPGIHQETIVTGSLSAGNYSVVISAGGFSKTNEFTVVR
ncbi:MAG: S8 family serine peptidase [Bacteroidota bacterium]